MVGMTPTPAGRDVEDDEVDVVVTSEKVARDAPKEAWEARRVSGVGTPGRRTSIVAVWRMEWAGRAMSSTTIAADKNTIVDVVVVVVVVGCSIVIYCRLGLGATIEDRY